MMWHNGSGNYLGLGWGLILIMGLVKFAILAAIVVFAVILARQLSRPNQPPEHRSDDALSVLKARYARGEITREQFLQMKEDLK